MGKNNNLKDFVADIADAIREKKGTTGLINPQDFSSEIKGIESGGGIIPCEWNDVNFYDYEGTILHSYTWDEFVEKNEMPPLPTHHKGLVCQEWNYTLGEVLEQGGRCDVGAIYIPEDGNTHIFIDAGYKNMVVSVSYNSYSNNEATINWGDGYIDILSYTSTRKKIWHTYTNEGKYEIVIIGDIELGANIDTPFLEPRTCLVGAYLSNIQRLFQGVFCDTTLQFITLPPNWGGGIHLIAGNKGVKHINLPRGNSMGYISVRNSMLETISIAGNTTIENTALSNIPLRRIFLPSKLTIDSLYDNLGNNNRLDNIACGKNGKYEVINNILIENDIVFVGVTGDIPKGVSTIRKKAYYYSPNVGNCVFPSSVTDIAANAFFSASFSLYDFRTHTTIPIIQSNSFSAIRNYAKIIVPDALYDEWIVATNWNTLVNRIVKASEYVEPTNN